MKKSSAAILESHLEPPTTAYQGEFGSAPEIETSFGSVDPTSRVEQGVLKSPDFGKLGSIYAITARRAGRLNATKISTEEREALLRERQQLLDKKFSKTITKRENNRLEYVRWSLDRIEDAEHGDALDVLELAISQYEDFKDEIWDLKERLDKAVAAEQDRQRQRNARR